MTEQEEIKKVVDKVTEYTTSTIHNQGLISYNDIPKLSTEIVKNLGLFSVRQQRELFDSILDFIEDLPMCSEYYNRHKLYKIYIAENRS